MEQLIIFGILSLPLILISWRTLFNVNSHGFYRFFSWECILWLFLSNYKFWFYKPFNYNQIASWILLVFAGFLVIAGFVLLHQAKKSIQERKEKTLYQFEKTTELIDWGIFNYIRHPLYSSLLMLTWGIYLKNSTFLLLIVALLSTLFLYIAAVYDEKECVKYFGQKYSEYIKRTKMFIPFIL